METVRFSKELELYGSYDLVVVGGGPAGVCTAVAAARAGLQVLLVESTASLGGMATSAKVGPFMTCYDRDGNQKIVGGLFDEIVARLQKHGAVLPPETLESPSIHTSFLRKYHRHVTAFDSFYLEIVLDEMVREAGVELLCYTQFADCIKEGDALRYAVLNAPQGMLCVKAKLFADCTGNAAVAEKAGVPTYKGDEERGIPQPATLMFEVSGADDAAFAAFAARPERPVKVYRTPAKGRYKVNHYHVYHVDATNAKSLTDAHSEARRQVLDAFAVLRDKTPGFENAEIAAVAPVLGIRESRHIVGDYRITVEDVASGTRFEDRIAAYGFGMDIHNRTDAEHGNFKIEVAERYFIPYRALLPQGCSNLLVAGKTLSCHSQAVGGMRCMPAAMAMGHAAGLAAAMAVQADKSLRAIDVPTLQQTLRAQGAVLD